MSKVRTEPSSDSREEIHWHEGKTGKLWHCFYFFIINVETTYLFYVDPHYQSLTMYGKRALWLWWRLNCPFFLKLFIFVPGRFRHWPKSESRLTDRWASWISQRTASSKGPHSYPETPQLPPGPTQPSFSSTSCQWKTLPHAVSSLQASLSGRPASAPRNGPAESTTAATAQSCLHWW